jgi:hypothetical protein
MSDYVPAGDEKLLDFAKNLAAYALANYARWGVPSPDPLITSPTGAYETALRAALKPNRGKVDVLAKNDAKKTLDKAIRVYVQAYLARNPLVTDEDKAAMGLPIYKTTRSPIPAPSTAPQLFIDTGTRRRLVITYRDEGSGRREKPAGVHGIEVRWAVLDAPPAHISALAHSSFDTNPPLIIDFEEDQRGKRVYLAGRWEIEREGEKGPFGAIEEAVIP